MRYCAGWRIDFSKQSLPTSKHWKYHMLLALLATLPVLAENRLVLNSTVSPPLFDPEQHTGFLDELMAEALQRLDYTVEVIRLPAERALLNANNGIEDGTLFRVAGLSANYPNLMMVPESLLSFGFVAFSLRDDIQLSGWDSLRPYSVGIIKGWKIVEANLPPTQELLLAREPEQLFKLLSQQRVDLVIFGDWTGLHWINALGLRGVRELQPPLAQQPMFVYLHRRHSGLVPRLAGVLSSMKADGSYWEIAGRTLCEGRPEWKACETPIALETPFR